MNDKLVRAILDGRFEETENGIFVASERTLVQGIVACRIRGKEEEWTHNRIVDEGLNYLLGAATGAVSPISSWYIAAFSGDVTVQASWTAANFATNSTEFTDYDEATRPAWSPGAVASGARDNFASKVSFTSSSDGNILRGAALISASGKGSTAGTLMGAARFLSDKTLDTGEILDVGYGVQLTAVV